MKIILAIYLLINLINVSHAGELAPKGTVLKEDSYVFSIKEAESLKSRILELEKKEKQLKEYIELDKLNSQKINLYISNEAIYNRRIDNLNDIIKDLEEVNLRYHNSQKYNKFENGLIFSSAVAVTVLSFLTIDYLNDNYIRD